ncbi:MAG: protein kinase, partial [Acidobacteriaceae bacterium]|nr:protein kinase [Acidobacteriaceae bacterium]
MTAEQWTLIKSIFSRALEIERSERDAWVRQQADLPPNIVEEVLRLLQADNQETALRSPPEPSTQPSQLPPGEVLLSRFEIQEYLGYGAMGDVYRAFDRTLHETIAIKTLRSHLVGQPNLVSRLQREVQLARRIRHANVCQILEFHQDPRQNSGTLIFFTMELLEGETLAARIGRGPLAEPEVLKLAKDIADGLQAIHAGSLVHRDLKPSNVFLVGTGNATGVRAVITDFGLCFDERVVATESLTLFGPNAIVGTPAYMSPEQLLAKGATKKSDVYAFGVVLFEMITGRLPFEGETPLAVAMRRLQEDAPTPRSFAPDLTARWENVILACLERDPIKRPASAAEVIEGLTGERAFSAPKRVTRRQMWALGAAGTAVLLAGTAGVRSLLTGRRAPHVPDAKALRHFKLGQEFAKQTSPDAIRSAIAEFEQAVSIDAQYAEAWAEMADAYCMASTYNAIPSRIARKEAEVRAKRAISIDASLSKAHAVYAYALATDLKRWRSAEESFRRAISLNEREPLVRSWYAAYLGRAGHFPQAITMAESALDMEPGIFQYGYRLATELLRARQYDRLLTHMQ